LLKLAPVGHFSTPLHGKRHPAGAEASARAGQIIAPPGLSAISFKAATATAFIVG